MLHPPMREGNPLILRFRFFPFAPNTPNRGQHAMLLRNKMTDEWWPGEHQMSG